MSAKAPFSLADTLTALWQLGTPVTARVVAEFLLGRSAFPGEVRKAHNLLSLQEEVGSACRVAGEPSLWQLTAAGAVQQAAA